MVSFTVSLTTAGISASYFRKSPPTPSINSTNLNIAAVSCCHPLLPPPYDQQPTLPNQFHPYHHFCHSLESNTTHSSSNALLPLIGEVNARGKDPRRTNIINTNTMYSTTGETSIDGSEIAVERRRSFGRGGAGNIRASLPVSVYRSIHIQY